MPRERLTDETQAWFWTPEWQAGEREVDGQLHAARLIGPFKSVEEMKKYLGD